MLFIRLWFAADGTSDYGQAIRWAYLLGMLGKDPKATKLVNKLDNRNFVKWQKFHNKNYQAYLEVARV